MMEPFTRNVIPPITAITIVVLVSIFLIHFFTGEFKAEKHTFKPEQGYQPWKWYRFFTSPLVHSNLFYLFLTVVALLFLGSRLEKKLGTMLFFWTQAVAWIGTVITFCVLGSLLYFISAYDDWMEAKHTGFGPILFCFAVIDSFVGKRDMLNIIAPWLLVPILPLVLHRVSTLSLFSGAMFGLLLARGGLGKILLPNREGVIRAQESWLGRALSNSWSSFCPVWSEQTVAPFVQSMEGPMCSDLHPTYESAHLLPMSSKGHTTATTANALSTSGTEV
jgi:membrane associated rhomboid family serine protease